jgi:hypothetical protein
LEQRQQQQSEQKVKRQSSYVNNADVNDPDGPLLVPEIDYRSGEIRYPGLIVNDVINEQQQTVPTGNRTEELDQDNLLLMPRIDYRLER